MVFDSRLLTMAKINSSNDGYIFLSQSPSSLIRDEVCASLTIKRPKDIELNLSQ